VRFDHVVERLTPFPDLLPPPDPAVIPVVLDARLWRSGVPPPGIVPRAAAVLVLVHPDGRGDARVVLTERATTRGGHHSGEVSFPGGRAEDGDANPAGTALREAAEEIALDPDAAGLRVLGELQRFWIPVSNFEVTPVVAVAARAPSLVASDAEVARIVHAPLELFLPGAPIEVVERTIREWPLRYGVYAVDGLSVWGATARILSQLGALVGGARA
jgi:8-oxo-dGTP pyrophosphatase MutT (NUDIX family)